jgi:hypothetical protein
MSMVVCGPAVGAVHQRERTGPFLMHAIVDNHHGDAPDSGGRKHLVQQGKEVPKQGIVFAGTVAVYSSPCREKECFCVN